MRRLYFVRHAESEANVLDILGGQIDYGLSGRGHQDAKNVAAGFAAWLGSGKPGGMPGGKAIDRLISSPLLRARQTASPFSLLLGLAVETDPALMEQDMGIFAGKTFAEAEAHPGYQTDRSLRWNWAPQGGESYSSIAERLRPFFARLDALPDLSQVLVVTHAVTLRLICALLNNTLPDYPTSMARNGEIFAVDYEGLGRAHGLESLFFGSSDNRKE